MTTKPQTPIISKPYPRGGGRYACKIKSPDGRWPWGPRADSETEAVAAALAAAASPAGAAPPEPSPAPKKPAAAKPRKSSAPTSHIVHGLKISNPWPHEGGFRCRITTSIKRFWAPTAATEDLALEKAEKMALTSAMLGSVTVRDAIDAHVRGKGVAGARPATVDGVRRGLLVFFGPVLGHPVGRLTPRRCQELYDQLQVWVGPRGKNLSVATHREYLRAARSWGRWVVSRGWLKSPSPMEGISGVGKRRKGKTQLSLDEARRFYQVALEAARTGDEGSTAVLMAISMGMRTSEILSRTPRDIDNDGTVMRIDDNATLDFKLKNESSRRRVAIPTDLQPVLAGMCTDKLPAAPLFPSTGKSGRRGRQWLPDQVHWACDMAKVPRVCSHSLRGVSATAAAAAGALPELVAKMLGHTNPTMTLGHYIAPNTSEAAALERGLEELTKKKA